MRRLIALILLMLPLTIIANGDVNDVKSWSDGKLTWDDFRGDAMMGSDATAMDLELVIDFVESENKGDVEFNIVAVAVMKRNNSSVGANAKTDNNLRYQQLQYDLLELYRRRLQRFLNGTIRNTDFAAKLNHVKGEYKDKSTQIAEETMGGKDEKALNEWVYFIAMELSQSEVTDIPVIAPSKFSYGGFAGVGYVATTDDLGEDFSGYVPFNIGLEAYYNRLKLKVDVSYGQPQINNSNIFDVNMQGTYSTYATLLSINMAVGYKVFKSESFSVAPFVGGYWSQSSWNVADYGYNVDNELIVDDVIGVDIDNFNWFAGIDFDYHFNRYLIGRGNSMQKRQMVSSLRLTPYVSYTDYSDISLKGYNIGVILAYSVNFSKYVIK